jgi:AraC-like DNA-binding protein
MASNQMSDLEHMSRFERTLYSGREWPLATRNWVVLQLSKGIAYVRSSGTSKEVPTGGMVLSPPGSPASILASQLGPATVRGVALCLSSLTGFLTALERQYFEKQVAQCCSPFLLLLPAHPLAARLAAFCQPDHSMNLQERLGFAHAFSEVLSPYLAEAQAKGETGRQDAEARLHQFINQMPESELADLSLAQVAKHLHCCERHASRLFHEFCGCNFRSYISELRLKKACTLLGNRKLKIIDVAIESGHGCLAIFNYRFKKRFAMTPSEWRERRLPRERQPARPGPGRRIMRAALALGLALVASWNPAVLC